MVYLFLTLLSFVVFLSIRNKSVEKFLVAFEISLLVLSIGLLVTVNNFQSEKVLYTYKEKVGTELTQKLGDKIAYSDYNKEFHLKNTNKLVIKKIQGDLYLEYKAIKIENKFSLWKFPYENIEEEIILYLE